MHKFSVSIYKLIFFVVIAPCIFLCSACSSGSGGSGDEESVEQITSEASSINSSQLLSSLCGIIIESNLVAEPSSSAEEVSVEVLSSDAVIITRREGALAGEKQLVKLHGITSAGVETLRVLNGIDVFKREVAGGAMFVPAGEGCDVTLEGGGAGVLGQVFSLDGENMNELMLMEGAAAPLPSDLCQGDAIATCYDTIGLTPRQPTAIELDMQEVSITSRCGAVSNGSLINPITSAEIVRVEPTSTSLVTTTRLLGVEAGNQQLVKLHGISSEGISASRLQLGQNFIINSASGGAYLVTESQNCSVSFEGGGTGVVGQLFTMDGESINEQLLTMGYAVPEDDDCSGELLSECYLALATEAPPEPTPLPIPSNPTHSDDDNDSGGGYVEGIIRDFLWKPVSEASGNVVVLVNPTNVRVVVNGAITETLVNQGPSNGRGTTARGRATGCAYGSNVVLQFFDSSGQAIPIITGGTTITVANGCSRQEFRR